MADSTKKGFSDTVKGKILDSYNRCCAACRAPEFVGLEFDHVLAWNLGGNNSESNAMLLCGVCNRAKGEFFMAKNHKLPPAIPMPEAEGMSARILANQNEFRYWVQLSKKKAIFKFIQPY